MKTQSTDLRAKILRTEANILHLIPKLFCKKMEIK